MEYDNTNRGILAKSQRKSQDTHPDYTGSLNVGGVEYWLSAWIKTGRDGTRMEGQKFFSLSVQKKEPISSAPPPASKQSAPKQAAQDENDFFDDVPF